MILLPPVFLVVGLVLSTQSKRKDDANTPQSLVLNPELYLKPGGQESYANLALLQNATNHAIGYIMAYFADYKVATELVTSIADVLNGSLSKTYNLGFKIRQFPAAVNLSQSSVSIFFFLATGVNLEKTINKTKQSKTKQQQQKEHVICIELTITKQEESVARRNRNWLHLYPFRILA